MIAFEAEITRTSWELYEREADPSELSADAAALLVEDMTATAHELAEGINAVARRAQRVEHALQR